LIVTLPAGAHHRIIAEIRTGPDGRDLVAISCWTDTAGGPRRLGQAAEFPVARNSKLTALAEAVRQAL
jgi:hypothetical protein